MALLDLRYRQGRGPDPPRGTGKDAAPTPPVGPVEVVAME